VVLAMQAGCMGSSGQMDKALLLLDELHEIPESELTPEVLGFGADLEMRIRQLAGQNDLLEAAALKGTRIFEQAGDIWSQANIEVGTYAPPLQTGRPEEAERLIRKAITRAEKIGHANAKFPALAFLVQAYIARGDLESAERTAREALAFGESIQAGLLFLAESRLGVVLLFRDRLAEAIMMFERAAGGPPSFYSGSAEGMLALARTAAGVEGVDDACNAAMRFLPRPGNSRGLGAWHAILSLTEALCLGGRRQEVLRLQDETENIAAEWDYNDFGFPAKSAAGIAAACAGNWARAEEHHRAAMTRMDKVPYVAAQPIARYWYADMLVERGATGDLEAAKILLRETIAKSDAIGLALYARLARQKLDSRRASA